MTHTPLHLDTTGAGGVLITYRAGNRWHVESVSRSLAVVLSDAELAMPAPGPHRFIVPNTPGAPWHLTPIGAGSFNALCGASLSRHRGYISRPTPPDRIKVVCYDCRVVLAANQTGAVS